MSELYETDRPAWAEQQAQTLRALKPSAWPRGVDVGHLIEELEELVAGERNRVVSLARRIMEHRLYLDHSPAREPRARWEVELIEWQAQLEQELTGTLRRHLEERLDDAYARARRVAQKKLIAHGEAEAAARLPEKRPYSLEDVLGS
jgi:hypothetical protein